MPHRGPTYLAEEGPVTGLELCLSAGVSRDMPVLELRGTCADRRRSIRCLAESIRLGAMPRRCPLHRSSIQAKYLSI
jgi:hypothetical protein